MKSKPDKIVWIDGNKLYQAFNSNSGVFYVYELLTCDSPYTLLTDAGRRITQCNDGYKLVVY